MAMGQSDMMVSIAAQSAQSVAEKEESLEDKLRAAMKETLHFWMTTDEDIRFRGAVGAVLLCCSDEEKERLEEELTALRSLSAMTAGVPVDPSRLKVPENPIQLLRLWKEVKAEEKG